MRRIWKFLAAILIFCLPLSAVGYEGIWEDSLPLDSLGFSPTDWSASDYDTLTWGDGTLSSFTWNFDLDITDQAFTISNNGFDFGTNFVYMDTLELGDSAQDGSIILWSSGGVLSSTVQIFASATDFSPWTLTLPADNGDPSDFLQTNGSGVTSWVDVFANPVFTGVVTLPVADPPTTDADGEIAVDRDFFNPGRDAIQFYDGIESVHLMQVSGSPTAGGQAAVSQGGGSGSPLWKGVYLQNAYFTTISSLCGHETAPSADCSSVYKWAINPNGNMELRLNLEVPKIDLPFPATTTFMTFGSNAPTPDYYDFQSDLGDVVLDASVHLTELATPPTSIGATWGRFWVDDNGASPNLPFFSDGSGVDYQLAYQSYVDGLNHLGSDLSSSTNDILTAEAGGALDMGDTDSGEEGLIWDFDNSAANAVTVNTMPGRGTNIIVFGDANEMSIEVTRWAAIDAQVGTFAGDHGLTTQREQRFSNDFMTSTSQANVNLASANAGNNMCIFDMDGTANLRVKPSAGDNIFVNGQAAAAEERITSPGNAGDFVCLVAQNAAQWVVSSQWPPPGLLTNEITWRADEWTTSGGCGAASQFAMPSGGTSEEWGVNCTVSATAEARGSIMMPSDWDAATTTYENVQFSLAGFHDTTESLTCLYDITCQCIGDGEAYTDTYTTESADTAISLGITTQDVYEVAEQANAIECTGTCAEGDLLRWQLQVEPTGTSANCANIELAHVKMKYTHQTWHEETP